MNNTTVDDSRWDVDTTQFNHNSLGDFNAACIWGFVNPDGIAFGLDKATRDFIIELVAEIERLQTQVVEQQDTIENLADRLTDYEMAPVPFNLAIGLDEGSELK